MKKKNFLNQFLKKISEFPNWVKEIIYAQLSEEIGEPADITYTFAAYKPVLTYRGRCELDFKKSSFDNNIYSILNYADKDYSISEIILNTYMSMEEIAHYFLFCVDEGYLEIPDNSQIFSIAGFIAGKYRTGEYFVQNGIITENQLNGAIAYINKENNDKKFGQILIDLGLVTKKQLDKILSIKEEAKKRFILDYNEIPKINQVYATSKDEFEQQINNLKKENQNLKMKLNQLLTVVKNNDK